MHNPNQYRDYFAQIAQNHKEINDFVYASVDSLLKLISDSRSKIEYPVLTLEALVLSLKSIIPLIIF